jgi:hypothetical protein
MPILGQMKPLPGKRAMSFPVLLVIAVTLLAAQTKPNFSGIWKLNLEKSDFGHLPAPASRPR